MTRNTKDTTKTVANRVTSSITLQMMTLMCKSEDKEQEVKTHTKPNTLQIKLFKISYAKLNHVKKNPETWKL